MKQELYRPTDVFGGQSSKHVGEHQLHNPRGRRRSPGASLLAGVGAAHHRVRFACTQQSQKLSTFVFKFSVVRNKNKALRFLFVAPLKRISTPQKEVHNIVFVCLFINLFFRMKGNCGW